MRLSSYVFPVLVFLAAGALSLLAAGFAVRLVEDSSVVGVRRALDLEGLTWADADGEGLQLFLIGTAPSEAERFRALSIAGTVVDAARVIDQMNVAETAQLAPPRFSVEILRNDSGVSLIGLVPASTDRDEMLAALARETGSDNISDLLEVADYPEPPTWANALRYGVRALRSLPQSKISIDADRVAITAMAVGQDAKRALEGELSRSVPPGVQLTLDISAPRPVITPFTLRYVIDERGGRFDSCSASSDENRDRIVAAARAAGAEGKIDCRIGLGVPSRNWPDAAEMSIAALARLGGGNVTFTDADVSLVAAEGTDQGLFDTVVGELQTALPEVFTLHAVLPVPEQRTASAAAAAEFVATLSPEGQVQLRGRIGSDAARDTADSFARAKFGSDAVYTAVRVAEGTPRGWSLRVLAGLEALSYLANGAVTVSEDNVIVHGQTGASEASASIAALLGEKLGDGQKFEIDVAYVEKLDPLTEAPLPEECEQAIGAVVGARKINFEPGSATIDNAARGILDDIAEILKLCGDIPLEVGGHTDSQGREEMNQQLSQDRAQTILNELRARRVLTAAFTARGYGESRPVADNGTEEGREANRRIEFRLIRPEPVAEQQTTLESQSASGQEAAGGAAVEGAAAQATGENADGQD